MFYKKPISGIAQKPFSLEMVEVKPDDINKWNLKKIVYWNKQEYALFTKNNNEEIMQSLRDIKFVRCPRFKLHCSNNNLFK
jgi:hypothetical protein